MTIDVLQSLSEPNVTSVDDFKVLVHAVSFVTKENVNNKSMNMAVDILEQSLADVTELITKDVSLGAESIEQTMKSSFLIVSNLMGYTEQGKNQPRNV